MKYPLLLAPLALAAALAGCSTNPPGDGQKLAREEAYAPTGTFIPRKKGTDLGGAQIGAADKQDLENQRNMGSSGLASGR